MGAGDWGNGIWDMDMDMDMDMGNRWLGWEGCGA